MQNPAACSKVILDAIGITTPSGAIHAVANAPIAIVEITRSPTLNRVTPSPTAATMPADSTPGTKGKSGVIWYFPCTVNTSGKFNPAL